MREYAVQAVVEIPDDANLTDAVFRNAHDAPDQEVFSRKVNGGWKPITARAFADEVRALASGLIANGIQQGDRIAIMSRTRYEWTLADYAIWTVGAITVPIYETSSAEQVQWILSDSEAVAVIVETDTHKSTVDSVRDDVPNLKHVWHIENGDVDALSRETRAERDIAARRHNLTADSMATLIYTSGTTGRPKGCELTHRNFLFDSRNTTAGLDDVFGPGSSTLLFLPLAHVFARIIQVGCVERRVRMGHTADIKNLLPDLADFKPTFVLSVPRVFEKVYTTAKQKAHADGKGAIFDRAENTAISYSEALDKGGAGLALRTQHKLFERLVYTRLRDAMGGQVQYAVSGGAPLGARLGHFFRGIGITILEGYGLTETTAGATCNRPEAMKVGTVGRPIPGVQVRIAEDGEILLKGGNIFRGYWHNEQATKETVDPDGWFHTGDIGEIDDDGYLAITGRKKELIVTAAGKNVAPAVLEDRIRSHWLVSQAMVVGDQRPFVGALITIDPEGFERWQSQSGKSGSLAELRDDESLRGVVQEAIDHANQAVSHAEAIKKFRILPVDFTEEGGQLTPTLKVKRNVVSKEFADEIEALYSR